MKSPARFFIVILVVLSSCRETEKRPDNLLTPDQMVAALTEIYIAEEKVSRLGLSKDSAGVVFREVESRIFQKLGIADSVFRASHDYYTDHPIEMEKIYGTLIDSLQLREQRAPYRPDAQ